MEEKKPTETTVVQEVEVSDDTLNELLGMPGAESVMVPTAETKKPSVFSKEAVDMTFLDNKNKQEAPAASTPTSSTEAPATKTETAAAIQEATQQLNDILRSEEHTSELQSH